MGWRQVRMLGAKGRMLEANGGAFTQSTGLHGDRSSQVGAACAEKKKTKKQRFHVPLLAPGIIAAACGGVGALAHRTIIPGY